MASLFKKNTFKYMARKLGIPLPTSAAYMGAPYLKPANGINFYVHLR